MFDLKAIDINALKFAQSEVAKLGLKAGNVAKEDEIVIPRLTLRYKPFPSAERKKKIA